MKNILLTIYFIVFSFVSYSQSLPEAKSLFEAEKWEQSLAILNELPESNEQRYYIGRNLMMLQNHDEAIEHFKVITRNDPKNAEYQYQCGKAYLGKLNATTSFSDKSILASKIKQYFEKAVSLDDTHIYAKVSLARYYVGAPAIAGGSHSKALKLSEEIKALDPATALDLQYNIYYNKKDYPNALKSLEGMLEISPLAEQADLYFRIGSFHQEQKSYDDAFKAFAKAIELDSDNYKAKYQFARTAAIAKREIEKGVQYIHEYLKVAQFKEYVGEDGARWRLGNLLELQDKKEEARKQYELALAVNPQNENVRKSLKEME
jgi:tetratricopeptide (TPR) repeat protein